MIRAKDLLIHVVRPVLNKLGMGGDVAEHLMLGTAAVESAMGYYLKQAGGPARGIYQVEPATERDIWDNLIILNPSLRSVLTSYGFPWLPEDGEIIYNLAYATIIARLCYWRHPQPLPSLEEGPLALANYWKRYYNTKAGRGTLDNFVNSYSKYVIL